MSKREAWHRIDYDPLPRPVIIQEDSETTSDLTLEEVEQMVDDQIEIRYIDIPPNDWFFRAIYGPMTGNSFPLNIPSDAREGDLVVFYAAANFEITPGPVGGAYPSGPVSWGFFFEQYDVPPESSTPQGFPIYKYGHSFLGGLYAISASDIGGTVTYGVTGANILDSPVAYAVLLKREKFRVSTPGSYNTGYRVQYDGDGVYHPNSSDAVTFFFGSEFGYGVHANGDVSLPSIATPLGEIWIGETHLVAGYYVRPGESGSIPWGSGETINFATRRCFDVLRS